MRIRAIAHVQDFLPLSRRNILELEGCRLAWEKALCEGGVSLGGVFNMGGAAVANYVTILERGR